MCGERGVMKPQKTQGSRFKTNHDLRGFVILHVRPETIIAEPCPIGVSVNHQEFVSRNIVKRLQRSMAAVERFTKGKETDVYSGS